MIHDHGIAALKAVAVHTLINPNIPIIVFSGQVRFFRYAIHAYAMVY